MRRQLGRARQPLQVLSAVDDQLQAVEEQVEKPVERRATRVSKPSASGPLRLGEKVRLRSLKMEGVVSSLGENEAEVQVGALRVRARLADIQRPVEEEALPTPTPARKAPVREAPAGPSSPFYPSPGMELDLRGQRAEDALEMLDRYLESAFLAGLPFVRVIHGKGTGKLRQVVRQALRESSHVKSFEIGHDSEGGDGVTVAKLALD